MENYPAFNIIHKTSPVSVPATTDTTQLTASQTTSFLDIPVEASV